MIGNAHIDPVWLWVWQDGLEVAQSTCRDAITLLNKYPDYIFTRSSAAVYAWIERTDPEIFKEIQRLVAEGRWNIVNGWWVQPDCNIPSGESLIRQGLYGQLYFKERFGKLAKVGFNVDTFGHCGTLPQILKKCGLDYYVFHRPGIHEKTLPNDIFRWQSPDGTRIIASRIDGYGAGKVEHLEEKVQRALNHCRETGMDIMCYYGRGDHGGGPAEDLILKVRELSEKVDDVSISFSTPDSFFNTIASLDEKLPVVADDLQHHSRGCYTVVSEIKTANRKLEVSLQNAEKFCAMASLLLGTEYPRMNLRRSWEILLFHQFHDVMGGTSIRPAYDDAAKELGMAQNLADSERDMALETLSAKIQTAGREGQQLLVFNPAYCERDDPIEFHSVLSDDQNLVVVDEEGVKYPIQVLSSKEMEGKKSITGVFIAGLPALGYRVFWIRASQDPPESDIQVSSNGIGNSLVAIKVDPDTGFLSSIVDKKTGVEFLAAPCRPIVVKDESDTWSHDVESFRDEIGTFEMVGTPTIESGPVQASITVTRRYGESELKETYTLHASHPVIECRIELDWHEKHKMLKMSFPAAIEEPRAIYEIPYGTIERDAKGQEEPGQRWLDVLGKSKEGSDLGLLLLNDCKYGFDVLNSEMRISLVRSPIYAFHGPRKVESAKNHLYTDQGRHEIRLGLFPHGKVMTEINFDLAEKLNNPPIVYFSNYHEGSLPSTSSFITPSPGNIFVGAAKMAEENDRIILRLFESAGKRTDCKVGFPLSGFEFGTSLGPWEIKTLALTRDGEVSEVDMLERNLILDE